MMNSSVHIESTLFFDAQAAADFFRLFGALTGAFADNQIRIQRKYITKTDLVVQVGCLTLGISQSTTPLDLKPFNRAKTPGTSFGPPPQVQRDLSNHKTALSVTVTGAGSSASYDTRLAVCYLAVRELIKETSPVLVHWKKSDVLYTILQFYEQTGEQPPLTADAAPCMSPASQKALGKAADEIREDYLRKHVFNQDKESGPSQKARRLRDQALSRPTEIFGIAVLSSVGTLLSQLLQGLRLG